MGLGSRSYGLVSGGFGDSGIKGIRIRFCGVTSVEFHVKA